MENIVHDAGLLPSIAVDALGEISEPVQQTDRHKRQPEIAGRFTMITGQNPQAARVDRQRFVKTELRAKISHERLILLFLG